VQKHRAFLKDHVVFKEVFWAFLHILSCLRRRLFNVYITMFLTQAIHIENVSVISKIHQTYRIGYLKVSVSS
jgi:protein phosphatase 4 regulatory subunit 3